MNIIITMAGSGERFKNAGYHQPKYAITAHGKTLFDWSLLSLSALTNSACHQVLFVVKRTDQTKAFIEAHAKAIGIKNFQVLELDTGTDGQATTAIKTKPLIDSTEPLLIFNIDTFIEPGLITEASFTGDGTIPCFSAEGEHWSFVKLAQDGYAVEVAEKKRISDHCSVGLYFFRSFTLFESAYTSARHLSGERYVAPLYNELIKTGAKINIITLPKDKVHVLGTPEELAVFTSAPAPVLP